MATRKFFLAGVEKLECRPTHKDYAFHLKQLMVKKFKVNESEISNQDDAKIEKVAKSFTYKVKYKYVNEFNYDYDLMINKKQSLNPRSIKQTERKEKWLSEIIKNPLEKISTPETPPKTPAKAGRKLKKKRGRPVKDYSQNKAGGTQQGIKAKEARKDHSLEKLIHMAIQKASADGNTDCAYILKLLKKDPEVNASNLRSLHENPVKPVIVLTPKECLAELLIQKLTERQYQRQRKKQKACNAKIFVSYHQVLRAKKECEPEGVDKTTKIGEISVPMQNVCDHQIRKILNFPEVKEKYNQLVESGRQFKLVMYGKYGADGTNTDTEYQNADAGEYSYLNKCLFQRSTM